MVGDQPWGAAGLKNGGSNLSAEEKRDATMRFKAMQANYK